MNKVKNSKSALTMVEALLVVSLVAVLSIAIFQTFSNGLKIWEYGNRSFAEEDISIFMDKFGHDLRNVFFFSMIHFKGESDYIEFPTVIITKTDPNSAAVRPYARQIGKVKYYYDSGKEKILRQQANYGQALAEKFQDPRILASGVKLIRFKYFYEENKNLHERKKVEIIIPAMVEVEILYTSDRETRRMTRRFDIPLDL